MVCVVIQTLKSLSTYTAIYGSNNKAEMKGSLSKPPQSTDCNAHSLLRVICILVKISGYKNYLGTTKHCAATSQSVGQIYAQSACLYLSTLFQTLTCTGTKDCNVRNQHRRKKCFLRTIDTSLWFLP